MGTRTSYTPGAFCWVDLATSDATAAAAFYTALFGWEADEMPGAHGGTYTTFRLDGNAVAGMFQRPGDGDGPPVWASYVSVADADATVARATELGATATGDAFDVQDVCRMATIEDPLGAALSLWQPRESIGAGWVNDVGCLCMNELPSTDVEAARSFYEALFGWTTEPVDTGPGGPVIVAVSNAGTLNATLSVEEGGDPHWRPYFTVASVAVALNRVGELGGSTLAGPIPLPVGAIAVVTDPQGGEFALFEGHVDP